MVPFLLLYFSTLYDTGSCGGVPEKGIPRGQYSELEKGVYLSRVPSSSYSTIFLILFFLCNYPDNNLVDTATSHYGDDTAPSPNTTFVYCYYLPLLRPRANKDAPTKLPSGVIATRKFLHLSLGHCSEKAQNATAKDHGWPIAGGSID